MKRFLQRFFSWWLTVTVPVYVLPTTLDGREMLRKRRLFSSILFIGLIGTSLFIPQDILVKAPTIQLVLTVAGWGSTLLTLWINRHGYLKTAASFYFSFTFLLISLAIYDLSLDIPSLSLTLWPTFLLLPVAVGLFLPIWGPVSLAIGEAAFMSWFVLYGRKSEIAIYLKTPDTQIQFLSFACIIIFVIALFSAIYASTTRKAVMQADRTVELEQAHQTISESYARLEEAHAIIRKQAFTDALTDLPNHRALMEQLEKELERSLRYERPFSLLFFDADRFKYVNDTYGHEAGDTVLRQIGIWAGGVLRSGDMLGRFGGEEFVVLLSEADAQEASMVAERVRAAVAASPVVASGVAGGIPMTVSIGFSTYPTDGSSEQELLSRADEAMYIAKRLGRNQVRSAEQARQVEANPELMERLRQDGQREAAVRAGGAPEQVKVIS